jgi:hypothetical protein
MAYHNTVPVQGPELEERSIKAGAQDIAVLEAVRKLAEAGKHYVIPDDIHSELKSNGKGRWDSAPLTSIRRSVNTLIRKGDLEYVELSNGKRLTVVGQFNHRVRVIRLCE